MVRNKWARQANKYRTAESRSSFDKAILSVGRGFSSRLCIAILIFNCLQVRPMYPAGSPFSWPCKCSYYNPMCPRSLLIWSVFPCMLSMGKCSGILKSLRIFLTASDVPDLHSIPMEANLSFCGVYAFVGIFLLFLAPVVLVVTSSRYLVYAYVEGLWISWHSRKSTIPSLSSDPIVKLIKSHWLFRQLRKSFL